MVGAHTPARFWTVPAHGSEGPCANAPTRRRSEAGFSLIELLVVLVIIAILIAIVAPQFGGTRQRSSGPLINAGAGAIWRGVQHYRVENHGVLPPPSMLANAGATLVNPGGGRYVQRWPTDGTGTQPMSVQAGSGATPPTTVAPRAGGTVLYQATGATPTGWLAAYSNDGRLLFRRVIGTSTAVTRPVG